MHCRQLALSAAVPMSIFDPVPQIYSRMTQFLPKTTYIVQKSVYYMYIYVYDEKHS